MTDKGQWEGVKRASQGGDSEDWDPENGKNVDIGGSEPETFRDDDEGDVADPVHTDPDMKK